MNSKRLLSHDYYNRYIHGQVAGGPGRLDGSPIGCANDTKSRAALKQKNFIPFD